MSASNPAAPTREHGRAIETFPTAKSTDVVSTDARADADPKTTACFIHVSMGVVIVTSLVKASVAVLVDAATDTACASIRSVLGNVTKVSTGSCHRIAAYILVKRSIAPGQEKGLGHIARATCAWRLDVARDDVHHQVHCVGNTSVAMSLVAIDTVAICTADCISV